MTLFWTNKPLSPKCIGVENLIVNYLARVIVESTNRAGTKGASYHMRVHPVRVDSCLFEHDGRVDSLIERCFLYILGQPKIDGEAPEVLLLRSNPECRPTRQRPPRP